MPLCENKLIRPSTYKKLQALKLHEMGLKPIEIASRLKLDLSTVQKYFRNPARFERCYDCGEPAVDTFRGKPICEKCLCPEYPEEHADPYRKLSSSFETYCSAPQRTHGGAL